MENELKEIVDSFAYNGWLVTFADQERPGEWRLSIKKIGEEKKDADSTEA